MQGWRVGGRRRKIAAGVHLCMIVQLPMLKLFDDLPACPGCGSCCRLVVELLPGVDNVPEDLVVEHDGTRCMEQRGDGTCMALDPFTRFCSIYERRPTACRVCERASPVCRKAGPMAVRALAEKRCPVS